MHFIGSTNNTNCYTQCSPSFFSFYKSLQLIFGISATYRFDSYLPAGNCLICRFSAQCMISKNNVKLWSVRRCVCLFLFFLFQTMYNIRFNQGLGKCYQPWRSTRFIRSAPKYRKICRKKLAESQNNYRHPKDNQSALVHQRVSTTRGLYILCGESYGFISKEIRCLLTNSTRKRDLKIFLTEAS